MHQIHYIYHMIHTKKTAFTLIEMLIVIVIIGILAAALIPRLVSVQGRARDTQRKADLRSIYNANEIFLLDNGMYALPANSSNTCAYNTNCDIYSSQGGGNWFVTLTGIITSVPKDPLNQWSLPWYTGWFTYDYSWVQNSLSGKNTYDLTAQLENQSDSDRCELKQYKYQPSSANRCGVWSLPAAKWIYEYSPDSNM